MTGIRGLGVMALCFGLGALASLLARLSPRLATLAGHLAILGGAFAGSAVALDQLSGASHGPLRVALPELFPFARLSLSVDGLSAFFLLVVSLVAASAAIYGPSYLRTHGSLGRAAAGVHVLALNVFVGSMAFLPCAGDALTFLFLWEGMTLASYVLVVAETRRDDNVRAGLLYFVMAHIGTALLLVAFLALTERATGFDFDALRAAARGLSGPGRSALFFLALFGFAAKAGVVPLHVWLPYAHPAAPSHVSALMSGVMLKVALYGIFRFAFDLLAPAGAALPASWGWTVLVLGTVSAVIGVLYALQQHDLKRLLAFHSVENVGIILMGAGIAMLLADRGGAAAPLATLALAAALLHTLNHAAFKGLLFLGAGGVLSRTHVGNMEELGGLARRMPWTAWLFLLGAVAISALPPLNGFVSEWMTFQALVGSGAQLAGADGLYCVFAASMLALTGGLAAACFVKAFGVTFLGRPRSAHAEHATEVPAPMIAGMLLLAAACVLLGIVPGFALALLDRPTAELLGAPGASAVLTAQGPWILSSGVGRFGTSISVTAVAALFVALAGVAWVARAWPRRAGRRLAPTWTCGMTPSSRFDYSATAFAKPLRLIFAMLYRPRRQIDRETADSPYVVTRLRYTGEVVDLAEVAVYRRVQRIVTSVSHAMRARSTGRIHGYIGFVLVTLLVVLVLFGRG
jgi:hydrogenase-4 component B